MASLELESLNLAASSLKIGNHILLVIQWNRHVASGKYIAHRNLPPSTLVDPLVHTFAIPPHKGVDVGIQLSRIRALANNEFLGIGANNAFVLVKEECNRNKISVAMALDDIDHGDAFLNSKGTHVDNVGDTTLQTLLRASLLS